MVQDNSPAQMVWKVAREKNVKRASFIQIQKELEVKATTCLA